MTKLISWNVNGLRACIGKGFLDFLHQVDADIVCLQETKLSEGSCSLSLMATASIGTTQKSEQVRAGKLKTKDGSPLAEMQIGYASWNG